MNGQKALTLHKHDMLMCNDIYYLFSFDTSLSQPPLVYLDNISRKYIQNVN